MYGAKSRTVAQQFAHIHNVRLMWVKVAAPDLFASLKKIEPDEPITKKVLSDNFKQSTEAIAEMFRRGFETGKIKGFKPKPSLVI